MSCSGLILQSEAQARGEEEIEREKWKKSKNGKTLVNTKTRDRWVAVGNDDFCTFPKQKLINKKQHVCVS